MRFFETIIVFILFSLFNIINFFPSCVIYSNLNFDFQALLLWDYSASLGVVPYKEVFYPYGVLSYFKDQNILAHVLFFLISPILLTALFAVFRKVWGGRSNAFLILILLFVFVNRIIGHDGFERYGIFVIFPLVLGFILYKKKSLTKKLSFIFGAITGITFWMMNDQGIYTLIAFTFNLVLYPFVLGKKLSESKCKYYKSAIIQLAIYLIGVIIGAIPLFLYLFNNKAIFDFFDFFIKLLDLSLYAKTPFPPYSNTPENIFTFAILISAIFYLSFRFIFREKITLNNYLQINLCFVIVFLEQKSLIRSIDSIITFPSFVLFILILSDIKEKLKLKKKYIYLFLIFVISISLFSFKNSKKSYKMVYFTNISQCISKNINGLLRDNNEYEKVKNVIRDKLKYTGKIFSYPGDPIFYILFKQIPPFYSNNYDSSPFYAQKKQIDYIKSNNVKYVIFNIGIPSVMDSVPNYIRTSEEERYIFNNFKVADQIGKFLILEKEDNVDLFANNNLLQYGNFKKYLTEINLENIPRSEGKYKKRILQSDKVKSIGEFKSIAGLNKFLRENAIFSKNKFMVFIPEHSGKDNMIIEISSIEGYKTSISYKPCDKLELCIVNLSKIPLFYNNRRITRINTSSNFSGNIQIIENKSDVILW